MSDDANPAEMYEEFLVPGIHARWTPLLLERAKPQGGERVLDVACGTGIVARNVAPIVGPEGRVTAVDASPDMLAVARKRPVPSGAAIEWSQCRAESLLQADGQFDLVLCQQALQFFEDRKAAVREMRRVLAPGGRAALSVWHGLDRHPVYEALCEAEARHLDVPIESLSTPFTMGNADELRVLLEEAGFDRVKVESATHEVRFPDPDRFVALTLLAGASIIPASEMDDAARRDLVRTVGGEIEDTIDAHRDGDAIAFPMHAHIAVAYA